MVKLRKAMIRFALTAALFALLLCSCSGTPKSGASADSEGIVISDSAERTTMPFDLWFNLIFVSGTVEDKDSCWFILDTGFEYSLLNRDRLDSSLLKNASTRVEKQPGGEIEITKVANLSLGFGSVTMTFDSINALPIGALEPIAGRRIDGIIGHDLFERFVVVIDYAKKELTVIEPSTFDYSGTGEIADVVVESNEPFFFAEVGHPDGTFRKAKLKLDTGSSDFIGFNGSYIQAVGLVTDTQPKIPALGTAVAGHTENWVTRIGAFRLGSITLDNPAVGYSVDTLRGGDAGTIGGEFFRRFTAIFDYPHHRLILEKNARFDDPLQYDMTGIFPIAEPPDFTVKRALFITPGSPADRAGIQAGDRLLDINGIDAGLISIGNLHAAFRQEGQDLQLLFSRGDSTFAHTLHLSPVI